jgi:hypothetical protein
LSWRLGLDPATAREKVRVARALGQLPNVDDALRRGTLSYAKARALTRVATPETEEKLLEVALEATAAQLERICRGYRQAATAESERAREEERRLTERLLPNGMVRLEIVLHPDEAALVLKAVERARVEARAQARPEDLPLPRKPGRQPRQGIPPLPSLETPASEMGQAASCTVTVRPSWARRLRWRRRRSRLS